MQWEGRPAHSGTTDIVQSVFKTLFSAKNISPIYFIQLLIMRGPRPQQSSSLNTHRQPSKPQEPLTSTKSKASIVEAGHGFAFEVKQGEKFRIIDTHGGQIVDLLAWVLESPSSSSKPSKINKIHHFSADHTRWELMGATPAIGEYLYTNKALPMLKITDDTVRVHDMTFACCYPELYQREGFKDHRSCSGNISEAMKPYGIESHLEIPSPFNCFQNTPFYALKGGLLSSKAGDYVEFECLLEEGVVVAVSSCPFDLADFAPPTSVEIVVGV